MCGEYGVNQDTGTLDTIGRPHYHAIIFGYAFPDRLLHQTNHEGSQLYTSLLLDKAWGKGFSLIGDMTFQSAAYVARYCMKKINGELADDHYTRRDQVTGELTYIRPEFGLQSRNPGIAHTWWQKYRHDMDKGFITDKGIKLPSPAYYHKMYAKFYEADYEPIHEARQNAIEYMHPDNTLNRLRVKEKITLKRIQQLQRALN